MRNKTLSERCQDYREIADVVRFVTEQDKVALRRDGHVRREDPLARLPGLVGKRIPSEIDLCALAIVELDPWRGIDKERDRIHVWRWHRVKELETRKAEGTRPSSTESSAGPARALELL